MLLNSCVVYEKINVIHICTNKGYAHKFGFTFYNIN
jgi:hypothetical protein